MTGRGKRTQTKVTKPIERTTSREGGTNVTAIRFRIY